jgi:hypothetical protein
VLDSIVQYPEVGFPHCVGSQPQIGAAIVEIRDAAHLYVGP